MNVESNAKPKTNGKKQLRSWLRRIGLGAVVVAGVGGLAYAFVPKPVPVEIHEIRTGPLTVTIDEDGKTRVIDRYVVSAPVGGRVPRLSYRAGDRLQVGDPLVSIEPITAPLLDARTRGQNEARLKAAKAAVRQADASVKRAKIAHEFAKKQFAKITKLHESGTGSRHDLDVAELDEKTRAQELESSRFSAQVARFELENAKATLARMDQGEPEEGEQVAVHAPVAGEVLRVMQKHEGVVAAGTPLVELADPRALEVVADVLTTDAVHIQRGDPVDIVQWGGQQSLRGAVRLVEPSAFTRVSALGVEEQRVNVVIDILAEQLESEVGDPIEMPDLGLGDGYRVEVRIHVWEGEVRKVPVSALFREGDTWAVFVVEAGVAGLRSLELGRRQGLEAEVRSGLEEGEQVIVHPSDAVVAGGGVAVSNPDP